MAIHQFVRKGGKNMTNCSRAEICATKEKNMSNRLNCVLIEDNILEFLDEIQGQISKGIVCCKCPNPCDKTSTRCSVAMKNLLTDIGMFTNSYIQRNPQEVEQKQEQTE